MKRINQFDFYQVGDSIRILGRIGKTPTIHDLASPLLMATHWLGKLISGELIEIRHCRHEAVKLKEAVDDLCREYLYDKDGDLDLAKDWSQVVPEYKFYGLNAALQTFEHNFAAELREAATYYVSQVGMYNTGDLVDRAEIHIPADLRPHVNQNAIREIQSAGACLAFDLCTAAGFHILRAAECVLDDYYRAIAGTDYKQLKNWNAYVVELEGYFDKDVARIPSKRIIRSIRQIKDLDRNPIMHPRAVLEPADAMITFYVAFSAITEMAKELKEFANQGQLVLVKDSEPKPAKAAKAAKKSEGQ